MRARNGTKLIPLLSGRAGLRRRDEGGCSSVKLAFCKTGSHFD